MAGPAGRLMRWLVWMLLGGAVFLAEVSRAADGDVPAHRFAITSPIGGTVATAPATIELGAVTWVDQSAIHKVHFFANGVEVGISDLACITCKPGRPGTPMNHWVKWENVPAGSYEIIARGETLEGMALKTLPVRLQVVDPNSPVLPKVTIQTVVPSAHESVRADVAILEIHRSADRASLADELTVHFQVGGEAKRGVDYQLIPESMFIPCDFCKRAEIIITDDFVTFAPGEKVVRVGVRALQDDEKEELESASIELVQPTPPPNVRLRRTYEVGEPSSARAVIQDASVPFLTRVSIQSTDSEASKTDGADIAIFEIRRVGPLSEDLKVCFKTGGEAVRGDDYHLIPESMFVPCPACLRPEIIIQDDFITIPKDYSAVLLGLRGQPEVPTAPLEKDEVAVISLAMAPTDPAAFRKPDYVVGEPGSARALVRSATPTPDLPVVFMRARDQRASERDPADIAIFEIYRKGDPGTDLEVFFETGGNAERNVDYHLIPESMFTPCPLCARPEIIITGNSVVIPKGMNQVLLGARALEDAVRDPGEVLSVTLVQPTPSPVERRARTYEVVEPSGAKAEIVEERIADVVEVSMRATDSVASEINGLDLAIFELYRSGPAKDGLKVAFRAGGTAVRGKDYLYLPIPEPLLVPCDACGSLPAILEGDAFVFDPGVTSIRVGIRGMRDEEKEGDETVVVQLLTPPDNGYRVVQGEEKFIIRDSSDEPGGIVLTVVQPTDLAMFREPATVEIVAVAVDPSSYVAELDFYANDEKIGESRIQFIRAPDPGTPITHAIKWENVKAGKYRIDVRTVNGKVRSPSVPIAVDFPVHPPGASLTVLAPRPAAVFKAPADVEILVEAVDPEGAITTVSFFGDDEKLGESIVTFVQEPEPGKPVQHGFVWKNVPAGTHVVHAVARRPNNKALVVSVPVKFAVDEVGGGGAQLLVHTPAPNQQYRFPANVDIHVTALDPEGVITSVTFFGDGEKLGESTVSFIQEPPPGSPVVHHFTWKNVGVGWHKIYAIAQRAHNKAMVTSEIRTFEVVGDANTPLVSMVVEKAETREPEGDRESDPAMIVIKRAGDASQPLRVEYQLFGTAGNGADYGELDGDITFTSGESERRIAIKPLGDRRWEPTETVEMVLTPNRRYAVAADNLAVVKIFDSTVLSKGPMVQLVEPESGAEFDAPAEIKIVAGTYDPASFISSAEFYANGKKIGEQSLAFPLCLFCGPEPGEALFLPFVWTDAKEGEYKLTARVETRAGEKLESEAVIIRVNPAWPDSWVVRVLPDAFLPGEPVDVTIGVRPPGGLRGYSIEERPPEGWQVTRISDGGVWDAGRGTVKFGVFNDGEARTLQYRVIPPDSAPKTGRVGMFAGTVSVGSRMARIQGDQRILLKDSERKHPADAKPADGLMTADEVAAYASAWKSTAGESAIDIDYVTRAGYLWRNGESYSMDPAVAGAPLWWVPSAAAVEPMLPLLPARSGAARPASPEPVIVRGQVAWVQLGAGVPGSDPVALTIVPPAGGSAWAIEWHHKGAVKRWGPFYGGLPEVMAEISGSMLMGDGEWIVSVDGTSVRTVILPSVVVERADSGIAGAVAVRGPRIAKVDRRGGNAVEVTILGGSGSDSAESKLEMSEDLRNWRSIGQAPGGVATVHRDTDANESPVRFYRLVKP